MLLRVVNKCDLCATYLRSGVPREIPSSSRRRSCVRVTKNKQNKTKLVLFQNVNDFFYMGQNEKRVSIEIASKLPV